MAKKKRYTFFVDPDQLRQLTIISEASLGSPAISSLIRVALADFIRKQSQDERIRAKLEPELRPRLVRLAADREPSTEG